MLHSHQVSYDAYGHPVIGDDLDGVSQLADLSTLDDIAGADPADATTPDHDVAAAGAGDIVGDGRRRRPGMDLPTPDLDPGVDIGVDLSGRRGAGIGLDLAEAATTTVMPPPASWSPDPPATSLTSSDAASRSRRQGRRLTAAGATTSGHRRPAAGCR